MNDEAFQTSDQLAATYLQHLQALAFELSVAMDAIAANAITNFQESVARQEMLCAVLATIAHTVSEKSKLSGQPSMVVMDASVGQDIRTTSEEIRQLNLQYAALLRHSGRSIALLVSLCRSHTGQHLEAGGSRVKRQTWSCEM
jgi:environmental stress-induced protein Ves